MIEGKWQEEKEGEKMETERRNVGAREREREWEGNVKINSVVYLICVQTMMIVN